MALYVKSAKKCQPHTHTGRVTTYTGALTSCALSIYHGTSDVHGVAVRGSALKILLHLRKNLHSQNLPAMTNPPPWICRCRCADADAGVPVPVPMPYGFADAIKTFTAVGCEEFYDGLVPSTKSGRHGLAFLCVEKESTHECTSKSISNLTVSH